MIMNLLELAEQSTPARLHALCARPPRLAPAWRRPAVPCTCHDALSPALPARRRPPLTLTVFTLKSLPNSLNPLWLKEPSKTQPMDWLFALELVALE